MNLIDINTIAQGLQMWCNSRLSNIPAHALPFFSKGGWEGWTQVELAMYFTSYGYDVTREVPCYNGSYLRADLVFNRTINQKEEIVVELKCQSVYTPITELISKDVQKLSENLYPYQKRVMVVLVIEADLEEIMNKDGYIPICYTTGRDIGIFAKIIDPSSI